MTEITVFTGMGTVPLVRLEGPMTESTGAELAAKIMSAIHYATEDETEFRKPLSLARPRIYGG